jgi:hypothetical protein
MSASTFIGSSRLHAHVFADEIGDCPFWGAMGHQNGQSLGRGRALAGAGAAQQPAAAYTRHVWFWYRIR